MNFIDLASPLENSAVVSIILVISHLSAVNNIFFVLLLRKHKSVYVNEFVLKKELKKKYPLIAHKNLQCYNWAMYLNHPVLCLCVLCRPLQAVLTRILTLNPSWWSTSSQLSPSHHTDASRGCRRIQTTSRTSPGRQDTRVSGAPTVSCSGTADLIFFGLKDHFNSDTDDSCLILMIEILFFLILVLFWLLYFWHCRFWSLLCYWFWATIHLHLVPHVVFQRLSCLKKTCSQLLLLLPFLFVVLLRYLLGTSALFVLGLLIGWFAHGSPAAKAPDAPSDSSDLLEELLRRITADKIDALQRWVLHIHVQITILKKEGK